MKEKGQGESEPTLLNKTIFKNWSFQQLDEGSLMSNNLERKNVEFYVAIVAICGIDSQDIILWGKYIKIQKLTDKKENVYIFIVHEQWKSFKIIVERSISSFMNRVTSVLRELQEPKLPCSFFSSHHN
jgi:hypothetical protein